MRRKRITAIQMYSMGMYVMVNLKLQMCINSFTNYLCSFYREAPNNPRIYLRIPSKQADLGKSRIVCNYSKK